MSVIPLLGGLQPEDHDIPHPQGHPPSPWTTINLLTLIPHHLHYPRPRQATGTAKPLTARSGRVRVRSSRRTAPAHPAGCIGDRRNFRQARLNKGLGCVFRRPISFRQYPWKEGQLRLSGRLRGWLVRQAAISSTRDAVSGSGSTQNRTLTGVLSREPRTTPSPRSARRPASPVVRPAQCLVSWSPPSRAYRAAHAPTELLIVVVVVGTRPTPLNSDGGIRMSDRSLPVSSGFTVRPVVALAVRHWSMEVRMRGAGAASRSMTVCCNRSGNTRCRPAVSGGWPFSAFCLNEPERAAEIPRVSKVRNTQVTAQETGPCSTISQLHSLA